MRFYTYVKNITCLFFSISLTACGGGGGGGKDEIGANPLPPASSSLVATESSHSSNSSSQPISSSSYPASSSSRSSINNSAAMLEGHIWHSFNDLDNPEGTFVMNPNTGVSLSVQAEKWGIPWPDGTAFINKEYEPDDAPEDTTRITVYRSNDKAILNDQLIEGYVGYIAPSPTHKDRILAHWGETIFSPRILIVWDLSTQKVLFGIEPGESFDALSWMPDGTLLHVQASGAISKVVIGGDEQLLGTVNWPESRVPQAVYVSPDGTRALVQLAELRDTGTVAWVDLWMMNIDGTEMRRFTNNGLIADAYWSPDSRNVAFVKDTGISCSDSTCMGSCTVWLAPATATEVVAVQASGDAKQFPLQRPNGSMTTLRCPVMAWTL